MMASSVFDDDVKLHFHRFEDEQRIAVIEPIARCRLDLPHGAGGFGNYRPFRHDALPRSCLDSEPS